MNEEPDIIAVDDVEIERIDSQKKELKQIKEEPEVRASLKIESSPESERGKQKKNKSCGCACAIF